jgi:hypothetical protein
VEERVQVRVQDLPVLNKGLLQLQLPYQGQARSGGAGKASTTTSNTLAYWSLTSAMKKVIDI